MSEAKHTPGPWKFEEGDRTRGMMSEVFKEADPQFRIGFVTCESHNSLQRAEDICNACLIAAAPELLEALVSAAQFCRACEESGRRPFNLTPLKQIEAAIAKATGVPLGWTSVET
ncbi:hypothetical protein [Planctomicrobium piriforme]|uniref:Uncharacterized protein n=1 Tax=Planctomicrobium piriforme TaxID=1576369 RepID=A0A1I3EFP2_9PLAN|nr:hypothetical protein [Planctomicrobium piriforme]SFH97521.1 hypothetical protein SAMN05421753_104194 [Planctomicrobium piriforme]